jgi:glycosyltransferase involved in cell wall biosynthesis
MKSHLAIIATHPIQYHAPWFRALAGHPEMDLKVLYCHRATPQEQASAGFNMEFDWDVSLLDGYQYRFLKNVSAKPTVANFRGLDTPEVAEIIKRERFDAVIINGWHYKSAWQAMRACWRTKTPVMARSDSHLHTDRGLMKRSMKRPLYRWFIPRLDACLPVGVWSRDYFLYYGARAERVFIVPHTVDDNYFASEAVRWLPKRVDLRARWGLDPNATVFVFSGKFINKKRPMDFVRAVAEASRQGNKLHGLMVGDGPLRSECQALAEASNVPVTFAGFLNQSEIAQAYVASDALVLPSDGGETWGLVVNEAMSCGRPCFVSDRVGCAPDLIVPAETGESFPMGDVQALASLMIRYAERPEQLMTMGVNAKRSIARCSVQAAVDSVLLAVRSVTNEKEN